MSHEQSNRAIFANFLTDKTINTFIILLLNPNESEWIARAVYPQPSADYKGYAIHFLLKM